MTPASGSNEHSRSPRGAAPLALTLATASTLAHLTVVVRGGGHGQALYALMAMACVLCAGMCCRSGGVLTWLAMGLISATMVTLHVVLMVRAGPMMSMSGSRGGHVDPAHLAGTLALAELIVCLRVIGGLLPTRLSMDAMTSVSVRYGYDVVAWISSKWKSGVQPHPNASGSKPSCVRPNPGRARRTCSVDGTHID